ncbi:hypothetical protein HS041_00835 [Planomonospora sp. ID67723]|uniref:DUF5959 family protein n=1 Tax=Planomonospora sp. ID67723 TaxID=2738134 RepID=UPI0018C35AE5|nr:DUF5959 family protein [Planomonospora sp. ID67723]MBG0826329.1 hypothetical protein [Planomonospora sp. ID67723]
MGEGVLELIHLADEENGLVVKVLGRHRAGALSGHDYLDAELVVTSGFAGGSLALCLLPEDLDDWVSALDSLAAGQEICWMDGGRTPEVVIQPSGQSGGAVVTVKDHPASGAWVRIPVRLAEGWVSDHRDRLERVRQTWPSEVEETSPGVSVWRDHRG